ncbi:MAG: DMT family transporter [Acidimicrobiales bacterium]|nr:DMT family transporter [Actinomycetes bacterium]MDP6287753.1 DMT family transporter [Acidimicrobiales bacterium]MDP6911096.1 DMT family transporter [Acidimicrobiales bacterium]HJM72534.1 DMT family transporter [Acidimicrobiales bacterium]HJP25002.1 DMT family transporter [Acidimicrobiales bacterium]
MSDRVVLGRGAAIGAVGFMAFGPSIVKKVEMEEMAFVFWRLGIAAAFYAVVLILAGNRLRWIDLKRSAVGGVIFAVNLVFFILSMRRTSAVNAVVIASLQPILLLAVGHRLFGERPHRSVYVGASVAFVGVVVAMAGSGASGVATWSGDLMAFVTMVLFAAYYVASKQARAEMDSITYQLSLTVVATVVLLPIALVVEGGVALPSDGDWWMVAAMAVIPGTGHLLTNFAHGHVTLTQMSLISLLFTAVAPLYAWWLIGERIVGQQGVGMAVVLIALSFVVTRPVEVVARTGD